MDLCRDRQDLYPDFPDLFHVEADSQDRVQGRVRVREPAGEEPQREAGAVAALGARVPPDSDGTHP